MAALRHQCAALGCEKNAMFTSEFCFDCKDIFGTANNSLTFPKIQEADPTGKDPHQPGAKVDAGKIRMALITGGMARAIQEVAKVGTFGAAKYTDGGWIEVPDGFRRYEDAQQRHATKRHIGETVDSDSGLLHLAHEAWNAMAKLDLYLREQERLAK